MMDSIEEDDGTEKCGDIDEIKRVEAEEELLMEEIIDFSGKQRKSFSYVWDMEEEGEVTEATEEEIQNDPRKKMLWAAENNKADIVETLLEDDENLVNTKDEDGYTPLHRASYNGHKQMVKILLSNGADIVAQTLDGWHPLHSASRWNCANVVSLLLQNGADINAQTNGGQTPLHLAASQKDSRETLELLLMNCHIDVNLKNSLEETARDICERTSELCSLFEVTEGSINSLK